MTLEGGDIVDKDGRSIWESRCYVTNSVIQNGAHGYGRARAHSLTHKFADRCISVYRLQQAVRASLRHSTAAAAAAASSIIAQADSMFFDWVVVETQHPVFQVSTRVE